MSLCRVVVIEDQTLFRDLLVKALEADGQFSLTGEAMSAADGLALCCSAKPDLVLLDVQLPDRDGLEIAADLLKDFPDIRILALTSLKDDFTIRRVLEYGLAGYVEKDQPLPVLLEAIRAVAGGKTYFTQTFDDLRREMVTNPGAYYKILSIREQQILSLVAEGFSSPEIAEQLKLSPRTAENHRYNIMKKLDLDSATELVAFAIKHGIRKL
ncbi:response regulator transcription factor [Rubellicoccus peritrichatus]|uniref:Response regulator transcription factor n=1 Tax=Rubellicoccus peritrichatus TaxID=3080537 RepID=A0AAQ3QRS9_9BACT|nr:response regulator transcription factor [Puniceicoccus sp. CR14]WOO39586.1 response regulator transcription factor [Puniceicoccus sp. CR14]